MSYFIKKKEGLSTRYYQNIKEIKYKISVIRCPAQHDELQGADTRITHEISHIGSIDDPWMKGLPPEVCISPNKKGVEHKQIDMQRGNLSRGCGRDMGWAGSSING